MTTKPLDDKARTLAKEYLAGMRQKLVVLPKQERAEVEAELKSHLYDSAAHGGGDHNAMQQAIRALGDPDDYLPEWVEMIRAEKGASWGSPVQAVRLIVMRMSSGLVGAFTVMLLGLVMLFALLTAVFAILALFIPEAGLYWGGWDNFSLSYEAQPGVEKVSNKYFVPIALPVSLLVFFGTSHLLSRLSRWWRRTRYRHAQ